MSTRYAPVALFVYNRADHFEQTYQALAKCPEAAETPLYIFSDGAKNEKATPAVEAVRAAVREIAEKCDFLSVTVTENEQNKGLAASIIDGVTAVLRDYGRIIVLEDDCVASPYLLHYMNACLTMFEDDPQIGSVAGFTPPFAIPANCTEDIFLARRSCSCCWATWQNRWETVDWSLHNMPSFYKSPAMIRRLNANGNDRFLRLYRQTKGNGSSWSVRFGAHHALMDWWVVYPRYSYITNIGCDESGVHSKAEDAENVRADLSKSIAEPTIKKPAINQALQKAMKRFYSGGHLSDSKRFLATWGIAAVKRLTLK